MKDCAKITEQLSAYIEKALNPEEMSSVERHIAECRSCAAELADLRKVIAHLHALEQVEPPAWMTQKVMAKVRESQVAGDKRGFFAWLMQPLYMKIPVGAVATAMLALTTYFVIHSIVPEMPAERGEQRMNEAPAQVPAAQKASDNAQTKKEARKGKEELKASAVEKSAKTYGPEFKAERPAYADKKSDSASGLAGGYAPAPQANYKAAAPASTPVYGREPELKGSVESSDRYKERAGAAKAMKSMPSRGYSADVNDRSIAKSQESPSLTARAILVEGAPVSLHMIAPDTKIAGDQVSDVMRKFGAKDIKVESKEDKLIVRAMLQVQWLQPLYEKLKAIGSIQEKTAPGFADVSSVKITVEIIKAK